MNTKIKKARFYRAVSRITKPIADSTHTISKIAFYVTEVETADGVRGQGAGVSSFIPLLPECH